MKSGQTSISAQKVSDLFGSALLDNLCRIHAALGGGLYLAGGTVRDLLLGRVPADIDLTVANGAQEWAGRLAAMTGSAYVPLGREEDAARVVWKGREIDFSSFREGALFIEDELLKRDITVNSLAVRIDPLFARADKGSVDTLPLLDPADGCADLQKGLIRLTSKYAFTSDPLRMLRVFRFSATLGFVLDAKATERVIRQKTLIHRVATERIAYELDLIMASNRAHAVVANMAATGLLWEVIPELRSGVGMEQPASHHLDVFDHCLETLLQMEEILASPAEYFPLSADDLQHYLTAQRCVQLKWAALLHDIGKATTYAINEDKGGQITFYNHDREGVRLLHTLASRLRWSNDKTGHVATLISGHMRPFHLANVQRRNGDLTLRACLRLIKAVGKDLPGLFLLSMADAMAGRGEERPELMEEELRNLYERIEDVRRHNVVPVHSGPPLLTGKDLIEELDLSPGPIFRHILSAIEQAHMEKKISSRREALAMAREYVNRSSVDWTRIEG